MPKNKSLKKRLTPQQRQARRYRVFIYIVTGIVLISLILSQIR